MNNNLTKTAIITNEYILTYYIYEITDGNDLNYEYKQFIQTEIKDEHIIFEKIFGLPENKSHIDKQRKILMFEHPYLFVEERPVYENVLVYIIISTVKYKTQPTIKYIINDKQQYHLASYNIGKSQMLYINNYSGFNTEYMSIEDSLRTMTDILESGIYKICRTWFYLNNIRQTYIDFNRLRKEFYVSMQIDISEGSNQLPASTCVEGYNENTACVNEFLCCDSTVKLQRIYNTNQKETDGNTYLYAPTFSRAMELKFDSHIELQISGTASIDKKGQTLFYEDAYNQIKTTMHNITNLLSSSNMDFSDIVYSTCFFKKAEYINDFYQVMYDMGIKKFPTIFIVSNICRDDLLFEMDGVAMKKL